MRRPETPISLGLLFVLGLGVFAGCDDPPPPPPPPPAETPPPAAGEGEAAAAAAAAAAGTTDPAAGQPAADAVAEIAYAYSPIGKRDPFRSLFDQQKSGPEVTPLTELQYFEVDQLRLVAIISRIATPYAMVEDPNGKGHTLSRGTLIGKNWGRVAEINPDCVVIKEEYRDYTGRKVTNRLNLCLPKPDELKLD